MKALIVAIALTAGLAGPAVAASWGYAGPSFESQAQRDRDGRGQQRRGERPERRGDDRRGERPPERRGDDRRDRLSDDDRRALHRDLDKANRELYQRRK